MRNHTTEMLQCSSMLYCLCHRCQYLSYGRYSWKRIVFSKANQNKTLVPHRIVMISRVAVRNFPHWEWVLEGRESQPFLREIGLWAQGGMRTHFTLKVPGHWNHPGVINLKYYTTGAGYKLVTDKVVMDLSTLVFFPFPFHWVLFLSIKTSLFPILLFSLQHKNVSEEKKNWFSSYRCKSLAWIFPLCCPSLIFWYESTIFSNPFPCALSRGKSSHGKTLLILVNVIP